MPSRDQQDLAGVTSRCCTSVRPIGLTRLFNAAAVYAATSTFLRGHDDSKQTIPVVGKGPQCVRDGSHLDMRKRICQNQAPPILQQSLLDRCLLVRRLDLEAPRLPSSSGSLKLPALGSDVGLAALEGTTKVLDGLPDVPLAPQQNSVGSGRSSESEGVESNGLTTGSGDSLSGSVGESECGNGEFGDFGQSLVVENGTDGNDGFGVVGVGVLGLLDDSGERDRGSVNLGQGQRHFSA